MYSQRIASLNQTTSKTIENQRIVESSRFQMWALSLLSVSDKGSAQYKLIGTLVNRIIEGKQTNESARNLYLSLFHTLSDQ